MLNANEAEKLAQEKHREQQVKFINELENELQHNANSGSAYLHKYLPREFEKDGDSFRNEIINNFAKHNYHARVYYSYCELQESGCYTIEVSSTPFKVKTKPTIGCLFFILIPILIMLG